VVGRIPTTHVGSLVRPPEVVAIMRGHEAGQPFSDDQRATLTRSVAEAVREEAACGIDIPSDGEFSKSSFSGYVTDRLTGFETRPGERSLLARSRDRARFPEAYAEMETPLPSGAIGGAAGATGAFGPTVCVGPISYKGEALVEDDIARFKAALAGVSVEEAFIPAVGPATIELQRRNAYYKTQEEYVFAIAEAMKAEYKLIVDAGFILQIDDPRLTTEYDSLDPAPPLEDYRRFLALRVEAFSIALMLSATIATSWSTSAAVMHRGGARRRTWLRA
jgi:5-methyltetrahydropteroyltriglutamate--homocysteine methyltransferase